MKLVGRKGCLKMTTRLDENLDLKMCYKCGTEYFKDWPRCPNCMAENNSTMDKCVLFKGIGEKIIAISLVLHCLFCYGHYWDISLFINDVYTAIKSINVQTVVVSALSEIYDKEDNKFMAAAKNLFENKEAKENLGLASMDTPETGIYQIYTNEELIAPFNIPCNSSERMYLLQFSDIESKKTVFTVFLGKNAECKIHVPEGDYIIAIAYGKEWFGDEELFGNGTKYIRYKNDFLFRKDGFAFWGEMIRFGNIIDGYLPCEEIPAYEFWERCNKNNL
jgi:hypothetical protein